MLDKIKKAIAESRLAPIFLPGKRFGNLVPNINLDTTRKQKNVLLVYLDMFEASIQISSSYQRGESGAVHTNRLELFQMIKVLIEMDFCIDVCGNDDVQAQKYIEMKEYDVIIGLGEVFRWAVRNKKAYSIIYMTENPYFVSMQKEKERLDYFYARHHKHYTFSRTGKFFKENDEKLADAVLCVGDTKYFRELQRPVKRIYPSAAYNEKFNIDKVSREKNNFLVFGTDGFIHKGIDLLIDIFMHHPEWNLFICGFQVNERIKEIMKIDISGTSIYDMGYIQVNSPEFLDIINRCRFILLPSCSEGMSTAVLTGMRHGLIPVVMHDNGLDGLEEYCYYFEDYHLEALEKKIEEICQLSEEELNIRSKSIYKFSNEIFTGYKFEKTFKLKLEEILKG